MRSPKNGYWTKKDDPLSYVYVERVYKKGYVTGIKYTVTETEDEEGSTKRREVASKYRTSWGDLEDNYVRKESKYD